MRENTETDDKEEKLNLVNFEKMKTLLVEY